MSITLVSPVLQILTPLQVRDPPLHTSLNRNISTAHCLRPGCTSLVGPCPGQVCSAAYQQIGCDGSALCCKKVLLRGCVRSKAPFVTGISCFGLAHVARESLVVQYVPNCLVPSITTASSGPHSFHPCRYKSLPEASFAPSPLVHWFSLCPPCCSV